MSVLYGHRCLYPYFWGKKVKVKSLCTPVWEFSYSSTYSVRWTWAFSIMSRPFFRRGICVTYIYMVSFVHVTPVFEATIMCRLSYVSKSMGVFSTHQFLIRIFRVRVFAVWMYVRSNDFAAAKGDGGDSLAGGSMVTWFVLFRCCGFFRKWLRHPSGSCHPRPAAAVWISFFRPTTEALLRW